MMGMNIINRGGSHEAISNRGRIVADTVGAGA